METATVRGETFLECVLRGHTFNPGDGISRTRIAGPVLAGRTTEMNLDGKAWLINASAAPGSQPSLAPADARTLR
jgi:hypothetical protein